MATLLGDPPQFAWEDSTHRVAADPGPRGIMRLFNKHTFAIGGDTVDYWSEQIDTAASGGAGAITVADGADVAEGSTTDAAVTTNANGTVSAKLRGLVTLFAARIPVLGQATKAASTPVTLASDQGSLSVTTTPSSDTATTGTISAADALVGGAGAAIAAGVLAAQAPTANSSVVATISSIGVCLVQVTPAVSAGSLTLEGSEDGGTNYFTISGVVPGGATPPVTAVSTATVVRVNAAALTNVRVRAVAGTAFGNGNIAVSINASVRESIVAISGGSAIALPVRGTLTDKSSTMAAGATSQVLAAANANRSYLFVANPTTATESLWINFTTAAVVASPSIELKAGDTFTMEGRFVSTEAVNVIATTIAHAFTAKEG